MRTSSAVYEQLSKPVSAHSRLFVMPILSAGLCSSHRGPFLLHGIQIGGFSLFLPAITHLRPFCAHIPSADVYRYAGEYHHCLPAFDFICIQDRGSSRGEPRLIVLCHRSLNRRYPNRPQLEHLSRCIVKWKHLEGPKVADWSVRVRTRLALYLC